MTATVKPGPARHTPAFLTISAVFCILLASARPAQAWYMTNNIAVAHVQDTSNTGMDQWTVGGTTELAQQSFWYRVGSSGGQTAVYGLPQLNISQSAVNTLTTENANSSLDFTINYTLTGGSTGSGSSSIHETINISNLTGSSIDLHFYQFLDLDLKGTASGDTLQLGKTGSLFTGATQTDSNVIGGETLTTAANHGEAGLSSTLAGKVQSSSSPAALADNTSSVGPGNEAMAFEWDDNLAAHSSFTITIDKTIGNTIPVPEPSTAGLLSLAFAGLVGRGLRRRSSASK